MSNQSFITPLLAILLAGTGLLVLAPPLEAQPPREAVSALEIAAPEDALTLARNLNGDVLLVLSANEAGVAAVNLAPELADEAQDALTVYQQLGQAKLLQLAHSSEQQAVPWEALDTPIMERATAIAAGTNYQAHAEEVDHEGDPFLFPKLSRMTPWNAAVRDGTRLDYEVELCALPLQDYTGETQVEFGFFLCGDFTDRWTLVVDIDTDGPMGQTGFPTGKGGESRFPIGPLLLIPRDPTFYQNIELRLSVNGELRQQIFAGEMIWSPTRIIAESLAGCKAPYTRNDETVYIAPCSGIAAGTPLLTGTPGGVIFSLANILFPWFYLGPGDEVIGSASYLGITRNLIIEAD